MARHLRQWRAFHFPRANDLPPVCSMSALPRAYAVRSTSDTRLIPANITRRQRGERKCVGLITEC